jgi:mannose-6-phosphate isomerase-like protein (cupin superfamily)
MLVALGVLTGCAAPDARTTADGQAPPPQPFVRFMPDVPEDVRLLHPSETHGLRATLVTLQPGTECGWQNTEACETLVICLLGTGEIEFGDELRRKLAAKQYAYAPPHTALNIFNTGATPMRYLHVLAPAVARAKPASSAAPSSRPAVNP